ncbi:uncharacterized protein LOC143010762 isoform X2 [Genypterus blacodes]|uniref:uncharacterized protein LOC143010762 isoform X2 n=1 Tax=Genypterus blacodes TaxID=154954 RepID=UPI003F7752C3
MEGRKTALRQNTEDKKRKQRSSGDRSNHAEHKGLHTSTMMALVMALTLCTIMALSKAVAVINTTSSISKNTGLCEFKSHQVQHLIGVYMPQCDVFGNFLSQQCWASTGYCWCVNVVTGLEVPHTRTPPGTVPLRCDPDATVGDRHIEGETFCPIGWTRWGTRCFVFIDDGKTWVEAEMYCQFEGGNLASIHGEDENHFIKALTRGETYDFPVAWVGGHDGVQNNFWMWSDGSKFNYENSGQETNRINDRAEHCLRINTGYDLRWQCASCSETYPFVCATNI